MNNRLLSKYISICTKISLLILPISITQASEVDLPVTFSNGDILNAQQLNDNFNAVESAVNDNNNRISTNTGVTESNANNISENNSLTNNNTDNIGANAGLINLNTGEISTIKSTADTHASQTNAHHSRYSDAETLTTIRDAGIGQITNTLITTEFTTEAKNEGIPINDGAVTQSIITLPETSMITGVTFSIDLSTSEVANLEIKLSDPLANTYILFDGSNDSGIGLNQSWSNNDTLVSGDLTTSIGNSAAGNWVVTIIDRTDDGLGTDGEITNMNITVTGFSENTATINGDLTLKGSIRIENGGPTISMSKMLVSRNSNNIISYTAANGEIDTLTIADTKVAASSPGGLIYYHPKVFNGSASSNRDATSMLIFNITSAQSIMCTLLSYEDDWPERSNKLSWATDNGNSPINQLAWGGDTENNTPSFMLKGTALNTMPLTAHQAHAIICF